MASPTFSKAGLTTLTFTKAESFPYVKPLRFRQLVGISEGGQVKVATLSDPERWFMLRLERLTLTNYTDLEAWLQDPLINGAALTFTYTNADSQAAIVRWMDEELSMPEVANNLYTVTMTLREEIS